MTYVSSYIVGQVKSENAIFRVSNHQGVAYNPFRTWLHFTLGQKKLATQSKRTL